MKIRHIVKTTYISTNLSVFVTRPGRRPDDDESCCKTVSFITLWSSAIFMYRVGSLRYGQKSSIMKPTTVCELIKHSI